MPGLPRGHRVAREAGAVAGPARRSGPWQRVYAVGCAGGPGAGRAASRVAKGAEQQQASSCGISGISRHHTRTRTRAGGRLSDNSDTEFSTTRARTRWRPPRPRAPGRCRADTGGPSPRNPGREFRDVPGSSRVNPGIPENPGKSRVNPGKIPGDRATKLHRIPVEPRRIPVKSRGSPCNKTRSAWAAGAAPVTAPSRPRRHGSKREGWGYQACAP